MTGQIPENTKKAFWIGGYFNQGFAWSDGQPVSCYQNYLEQNDINYVSNDVSNEQKCLLFGRSYSAGGWGLSNCVIRTKRNYVCKKGNIVMKN